MKNIAYFKQEIKNLEDKLKETKTALKNDEKFTQDFLNKCGKVGIKGISIGMRSNEIKATKNYPFSCKKSVFQSPSETRGKDDWCATWGVVERTKIACDYGGSSDQHDVEMAILLDRNDNLIIGVYELKNKTWRKVE